MPIGVGGVGAPARGRRAWRVEGEIRCRQAGHGHGLQGNGVRSVIGDDHPHARLGHVTSHHRVIGKQGGGEVDQVMAAAGRRKIGDRVSSEAGVEDEAIRAKIAKKKIVVRPAVKDIGAAIAEEEIGPLRADQHVVAVEAPESIGAGVAREGVVEGRA